MKYTATSLTLIATLVAGCGSSSSTPDTNDNSPPNMPGVAAGGTDQGTGSDTSGGADPDVSTGGGSMPIAEPDGGVSAPVGVPGGGTSTPVGVVQDGNLTGNFLRVGFIDIEESPSSSTVDVAGFFVQLDTPMQGSQVIELLQGSQQEQCIVSEFETVDVDDFDFLDLDDIQFTNLSAGNVITLSGLTGTYGELVEQSLFGFSTYLSFSPLPFPAPNPLIIDILGAAFPAFSAVEIAAAPQLNNPSVDVGDSFSAATTLTWDVATIGDARIILNADVDTASGTTVELDCVIADDGMFTLPANTVSELDGLLGGSGWSVEIYSLGRVSQAIRSTEGSVLFVTREATDN